MNPRPKSTVERLQTLLQGRIRVLSGRQMVGCITYRGLRFAHPRLSPVGLRLRVRVLSGRGRTCILDFCEKLYPYSVLPYAPTAWLRIT